MVSPAPRFQREQKPVLLAPPVKARLTAIKERLEADKRRQVTFNEVVEMLFDRWDATGGLMVQVTESQEAGR